MNPLHHRRHRNRLGRQGRFCLFVTFRRRAVWEHAEGRVDQDLRHARGGDLIRTVFNVNPQSSHFLLVQSL